MMMTRLAVNNFELLPDSVLRDPVAARAGTHSHAHFVLIINVCFCLPFPSPSLLRIYKKKESSYPISLPFIQARRAAESRRKRTHAKTGGGICLNPGTRHATSTTTDAAVPPHTCSLRRVVSRISFFQRLVVYASSLPW